ncbi:hypothetical protein P154DRAFT_612859 [Amniculicola lignicola CBS 123094]|uniref:Uncharacterized protein n=1 Tax=Amniculicola lignicola CBS 123094 TaxID=1392246 RepID=A0A6A5W6J9_9PLEO|nr:hypothetical protein P154DRAFT_612859 [Amniculicola lignicola CBS 123094]
MSQSYNFGGGHGGDRDRYGNSRRTGANPFIDQFGHGDLGQGLLGFGGSGSSRSGNNPNREEFHASGGISQHHVQGDTGRKFVIKMEDGRHTTLSPTGTYHTFMIQGERITVHRTEFKPTDSVWDANGNRLGSFGRLTTESQLSDANIASRPSSSVPGPLSGSRSGYGPSGSQRGYGPSSSQHGYGPLGASSRGGYEPSGSSSRAGGYEPSLASSSRHGYEPRELSRLRDGYGPSSMPSRPERSDAPSRYGPLGESSRGGYAPPGSASRVGGFGPSLASSSRRGYEPREPSRLRDGYGPSSMPSPPEQSEASSGYRPYSTRRPTERDLDDYMRGDRYGGRSTRAPTSHPSDLEDCGRRPSRRNTGGDFY